MGGLLGKCFPWKPISCQEFQKSLRAKKSGFYSCALNFAGTRFISLLIYLNRTPDLNTL